MRLSKFLLVFPSSKVFLVSGELPLWDETEEMGPLLLKAVRLRPFAPQKIKYINELINNNLLNLNNRKSWGLQLTSLITVLIRPSLRFAMFAVWMQLVKENVNLNFPEFNTAARSPVQLTRQQQDAMIAKRWVTTAQMFIFKLCFPCLRRRQCWSSPVKGSLVTMTVTSEFLNCIINAKKTLFLLRNSWTVLISCCDRFFFCRKYINLCSTRNFCNVLSYIFGNTMNLRSFIKYRSFQVLFFIHVMLYFVG